MRHDFTDKYACISSPVQRLDPRAKIIASVSGIIIVVTEPLNAGLDHMLLYLALILAVAVISRLPLLFLAKRVLLVSPFIIAASLFYPLSVMLSSGEYAITEREMALRASMVIFSRALLAIIILILLTSTEKFHRILLALRKLMMPKVICSISALLYRYTFLLADETLRTTRARESRTPGRLKMNRIKVFGNQAAMIFLRSWERSQTIYKSMLSRGFAGEYPDMQKLSLKTEDVIFASSFVILMLSIRILVH